MTDYTLACPDCGADAEMHDNEDYDGVLTGCRQCPCPRTAASLYAAECAKLDARLAMNAETFRRVQAERDAARAECDRYKKLLDGVTDLCVTQGHPKYGIEVTLVKENQYHVTVTNQPSWLEGVINARTALDADHTEGKNG